MRKLTLAIGAAAALAAAPAAVVAGQFHAVNDLDYTVYVGCGSHFRSVIGGSDTEVFECSQPITFQKFAGTDASALEHSDNCSDPNPVQRISVEEQPPPSTNWGFRKSCEAAPS